MTPPVISKEMKDANKLKQMHDDQPFFHDSSFAFCPAERTISRGRGANDDQCSCFDTAISG